MESQKSVLYKYDFIYMIYWVTHVTDDLTDDIIWIQGTRLPWFDTRLGHLEKEKSIHSIYVLYILYLIYI